MRSRGFERFAGISGVLAGVAAFLYAVSFIILKDMLLSAIFLTLVGILSTAALVAVFNRVAEADPAPAIWALLLGFTAALGTAIHGGYDLANAVQVPPSDLQRIGNLPSQIDPRGLLTFGVMGIALFALSWLIGNSEHFPRALAYLGYVSAVLLVILYLGRLIILNPASPAILLPALLNGFIVGPIWYIWLGYTLWTEPGHQHETTPSPRRVQA